MSPRGHLILFVRAPRFGTVKRRLAAGIGEMAAWRFYRGLTLELVRRLQADPRWRTVVAVTPDRFARGRGFWPAKNSRIEISRIGQGGGDLGERMMRALTAFSGEPAVLVGSDIPALEPRHIARAFALLASHDAVFGPARDGGFWLVGVRDARLFPGLFRGVRWSGPETLAQTLENLAPNRRVMLLETLEDVDDKDTYDRWRTQAVGLPQCESRV